MINIVTASRISELTESKSRLYKLKQMISNWKAVVIVSVLALTLKTASEQLVLLFLRHQ